MTPSLLWTSPSCQGTKTNPTNPTYFCIGRTAKATLSVSPTCAELRQPRLGAAFGAASSNSTSNGTVVGQAARRQGRAGGRWLGVHAPSLWCSRLDDDYKSAACLLVVLRFRRARPSVSSPPASGSSRRSASLGTRPTAQAYELLLVQRWAPCGICWKALKRRKCYCGSNRQ